MVKLLIDFMNNMEILFAQMILGVILFILLLLLFFIKSSRDERGRSIIGKASIASSIYFMCIMTFFAQILQLPNLEITAVTSVSIIQFIFNTVVLLEIVLICVLKKVQ